MVLKLAIIILNGIVALNKVSGEATAVLDVNLVTFIIIICRNENRLVLFNHRCRLLYRCLNNRLFCRCFNDRLLYNLSNRLLDYRLWNIFLNDFLIEWLRCRLFHRFFNRRLLNNLFNNDFRLLYNLGYNLFNNRLLSYLFNSLNNRLLDYRLSLFNCSHAYRVKRNLEYSLVFASFNYYVAVGHKAPAGKSLVLVKESWKLKLEVV